MKDPREIRAAQRYDAKLAALGRLARLEPYAGARTPILHRCLRHGEEHRCAPTSALQGRGLTCCQVASNRARGDHRQADAAARYDEKLAVLGKMKRLEAYAGARTPILHRCLAHGEEHRCAPTSALAGNGLSCCKLAAHRAQAQHSKAAAAEVYDSKLAALGRLVRLDPYNGALTPILHRCLLHGEESLCSPAQALQGGGLRCCQLASNRATGDRRQRDAAARYDNKLASMGRIVRLEPYAGSKVPILHRCLLHDEDHLCMPSNALKEKGLQCCFQASVRENGDRRQAAAAGTYDARLAALGRMIRLEPYAGAMKPILHRCLEHGEEHRIRPNSALQGGGLRCCKLATAALPGNLLALIWRDHGTELLEPCQLYVYTVPGRPELVKPGIARDHLARARVSESRALYDEPQAVWDLPARRDALLVEGAILRDPAIPRPAYLGALEGLGGSGEVREIDAEALVAHAQTLVDSLAEHAGPWQAWVLDNVPGLSLAERKALRVQLAAIQPSPKLEP